MKAKINIPKMPAYTRTRNVEAARITGWAQGKGPRYLLSLDVGATIEVTAPFMQVNNVQIGSYLINSGGRLECITAERFAAHYKPAPVEQKKQVEIFRHLAQFDSLASAQSRSMDHMLIADMVRR